MKISRAFLVVVGMMLSNVFLAAVTGQAPARLASTPVYVPDYSHSNDPLPDGIIAWDALQKSVDATYGQALARYTFSFTNISKDTVTILSGRGSCSCTTVTLPETPWRISAGGTGKVDVTIDLTGKLGALIKTVTITTDHGTKQLLARVNIPQPTAAELTDDQKMAGIMAAKVDRQAIFKGDCATCHLPTYTKSLSGPPLFNVVCAVCHEAKNRATMVPDLGNLKVPTDQEFWRTWITFGKPGSLMPAFATSQGGPLTDMQIASLAAYLTNYHPSKVPAVPQ